MSDDKTTFTKGNLDLYFKELSKELKREFGRQCQIELVVVGGASILLNYDFRESTTDIDALVSSKMSIKDAINRVGDKFGLPNGWVNSDFRQTASYSPKLVQYSKFYKTYNQVLMIRTIDAEYLIAMKLMSMRVYKNDISDIVGIIQAQALRKPVTYEKVESAVKELYGGWEKLPNRAKETLENILDSKHQEITYEGIRTEEKQNRIRLQNFEKQYENVLNEDNLDEILEQLEQREIEELEDMDLEI